MKDRIVAFGCSFTSGHELADHTLLNMTFDECNLLKKKFKHIGDFDRYLLSVTGMTEPNYIEASYQYSYIHVLADKLNIKYKNYATPGQALEHSYMMLLNAHYNGELDPRSDTIFFGLTSPHRYLLFDDDGAFYSRVLTHWDITPVDLHYNDYKAMQLYLSSLAGAINFCKAKGYDYIFQPVVSHTQIDVEWLETETTLYIDLKRDRTALLPAYSEVLSDARISSVNWNLSLFDSVQPIELCGYNHPNRNVHIRFAETLAAHMSVN